MTSARRPRVALVLGAGGLKCLAGIALFDLLEELAITPDLLVGAGGGGILAAAGYASSAVPPLLPALRLDGRLLGDAFYSATLPVLEAVKRDVDVIIAISTEELAVNPPRGLIRFYMYAFTRALAVSPRLQTAMAIQLHHHEIVIVRIVLDRDIDVRDAAEVPRVLEAGRRAVAAKRHDILEALANWSPST